MSNQGTSNTLNNAHMDTYDEPPMSLAEAKKISRAWVADNEKPNAKVTGVPALSARPG